MTPLDLLASTRLRTSGCVVLAARPAGVLHAFAGPLTPSGRFTPRAARPACGVHTRVLRVIPLSEVRRRRVCVRCTARLAQSLPGEASHPTRAQLQAAYDGVTPFDLAVDAWRAQTSEDLARVEWLTLLLVGYPACTTDQVVSPEGKVTGPLDDHIAKARRRLGIVRDAMGPELRAAANENELLARHAAKQRRHEGWRDREDRIARLGFINATA